MAKSMKIVAVFCVTASVIFSILNMFLAGGVWLSFAITFGTIAYHFVMRLHRQCARQNWFMKPLLSLVFFQSLRRYGGELLSGYAIYAPATLVIKGLAGVPANFIQCGSGL